LLYVHRRYENKDINLHSLHGTRYIGNLDISQVQIKTQLNPINLLSEVLNAPF